MLIHLQSKMNIERVVQFVAQFQPSLLFFPPGHRVLLFSTMTRLLDLLEVYLRWRTLPDGRQMGYRRIDGHTPLESREMAIRDFNQPDSDAFVFLLSIRAAGRGLNLQSADTVIIYDPDANPKNEEQAIARSHRIGQKKEVRQRSTTIMAQHAPYACRFALTTA